ncbi:cell wall adhesin EAP1-like [Strongylocentrotus purpuratus]|uniref:Apple domain-containing protein n=1 Tax=Strongylocentrotus purpuratus TaxID=7668 RepID=A0A7M7NMH5_STRPU|nr:cell wall adhesin EAP1-like [Strongylocentrotus purpuratus]
MGGAVLSTPMEFSQPISPLVLENTTSAILTTTEMKTPVTIAPATEMKTPVTGSPATEMKTPVTTAPATEMTTPVTRSPTAEMKTPVTRTPATEMKTLVTTAPATEMKTPVTRSPTTELKTPVTRSPTTEMKTPVSTSPPPISKRSAVYRLVARDRALTDTHSSHPDVRSVIRCGHLCFEDESCKFFTYIKRTGMCLLGQRSTTEIHHEAATFTC